MIKKSLLLIMLWAVIAPVNAEDVKSLELDGTRYLHRLSDANQHEYTPADQEDLSSWRDMMTVIFLPEASNAEQLVDIVNRILSSYKSNGAIVKIDSIPRTENSDAEHLIVAILRGQDVVESIHTRVKLVQGTGTAMIWSRRARGEKAAEVIGSWLQNNGVAREKVFMAWEGYPSPVEFDQ